MRGRDLVASASEERPVSLTLGSGDPQPTLAPPALTDQRALYNFGYDAPYHGHNETGTESGAKFGQYYVDLPNCWRSVVRWVASDTELMRRGRTLLAHFMEILTKQVAYIGASTLEPFIINTEPCFMHSCIHSFLNRPCL